jgi:hypothetical protein
LGVRTVAYDVATALVSGGLLPELTYRQAVAFFTENGTAELINLIGPGRGCSTAHLASSSLET